MRSCKEVIYSLQQSIMYREFLKSTREGYEHIGDKFALVRVDYTINSL